MIQCGASKKNITPAGDIGDIFIAGYKATKAPKITGIHDEIFARAMVITDGDSKLAFVSVECIGLLANVVEKIKDRLDAHGFKHRNVFIFATHTHAAPDTMGLWGPVIGMSGINKKYIFFLIDSIVTAVLEAEKTLQPSKIFYSKGSLEKKIINYRIHDDIIPDLHVLRFLSLEGNGEIASLWTYTAQPEITGRENTLVSADYPGIVSSLLEGNKGGIALFGLGLCGSQTPIFCEQGFEKVEEFARSVYDVIEKAIKNENEIESSTIEVRERKVRLPVDNGDFLVIFKIGIFNRQLFDGKVETIISKVRIGNVDVLNIPGEPFPGIASKVIEEQGERITIPIGMSNDALGYFIPLDQYKLKTAKWIHPEKEEGFIGHETESLGHEASDIIKKQIKELFIYKKILAIGAHADDLTIWAGGTLKKLSSEGNEVTCVRVCDDWEDCVNLSREKAIKRNLRECDNAYGLLGARELIHLDYPSDYLAGEDYLELRGKIVRLIRKYKPDVVISFDLNGTDEENQDHIIVANAVNEACWQSSFDSLYPEHFDEGLSIHAPGERYLFARNPTIVNFHVDISDFIDDKVQAINKHVTVMKNFFHQYKLLAKANRLKIELIEKDYPNPVRSNLLVKLVYGEIGEEYGVKYAEIFNKVDAGLLKELAEDD
ncbi:MAG: neutral/alkaline non-lysosomal ceramidase N-terminal domain-containing protein [Candidatus Hodarchaeota archaeon]